MALRVLIGEAAGQNWWCVVYPPLCMTAAADVQETGIACGMEQEELKLMQEAGVEVSNQISLRGAVGAAAPVAAQVTKGEYEKFLNIC